MNATAGMQPSIRTSKPLRSRLLAPLSAWKRSCAAGSLSFTACAMSRAQIPAYSRLGQLFNVLPEWDIILLDERAADQFASLRQQRIRIGTMDLKIASIALVNDALLVTANLHDFSQVPGLRCENWLQT